MDPASARLLVVDDDANNRDMLSRRLARHGYVVAAAIDGPHALTAMAKQPFDLILLDIEMPIMNGFDVLRKIRTTHPATQLPVIIATAHGDREDVVEALKLGANDFVTKPLDFPVVLARVQTQLTLKCSVDRIVSLEADLRKRNTELEQANGRMKHSLDLASQMQHALLPAGPVRVPGLDFAWVYQPCDELGGDILNVFPLCSGHVVLYLADVSGHGVPAALLSVTLSRMLSAVPGQPSLVEEQQGADLVPRSPSLVVAELNRRFQMSGDFGQYFTLFYGVLDVTRRQLRFVCAGHPPALHIHRGETSFIETPGLAVGWFDNTEFEEHTLEMHEADRLYIYSDGVTETMNSAMQQFGTERLACACQNGHGTTLSDCLKEVLTQASSFRGKQPVQDDISALAMEIGRTS